jgi:hypothetical protein
MKAAAIGLSPDFAKVLQDRYTQVGWILEKDCEGLLNTFEQQKNEPFILVVAGDGIGQASQYEVGQLARSEHPKALIVAVCTTKDNLAPKVYKKNGFDEVYLLPLDKDLLLEKLDALVNVAKNVSFKRVKAFDIQGGTTLPFDTYVHLPRNNKYVRFSKAASVMEEKRTAKLEKHEVKDLHINHQDSEKFNEYMAEQIAKITSAANAMGATEREEKLKSFVREVFVDVFDRSEDANLETGREVMANCQKVVSLVLNEGKSDSFYKDLTRSLSGQTDDYSHAVDVSTFAALLRGHEARKPARTRDRRLFA